MKNIISKIKKWYRKLPEKKNHVEFITAVLSVPVMLTVIIINLNNLNNANKKQSSTEKAAPIQVIITGEKSTSPANTAPTGNLEPTSMISPTQGPCIKEVGPISIISPRENEVVAHDPVCITLATESSYCSIVWSYRIDGGDWSNFTDKNICLHNLTNGTKTIQLKIKSTSSSDEVVLQRTFVYQGNNEPTTAPIATTSATTQ